MGGAGVQCGSGLVAQQNLGIGCQRTGNGNSLLLTAGQLRRIVLGLIGQSNQLQQLHSLLPGVGLFHARQLQWEADIPETVPLHQQIKSLKNHGDVPPRFPQLMGTERAPFPFR